MRLLSCVARDVNSSSSTDVADVFNQLLVTRVMFSRISSLSFSETREEGLATRRHSKRATAPNLQVGL